MLTRGTRPDEGHRADEQRLEKSQLQLQQDITQPDQIPVNSSITDQHLHTPGSDEEQMGIDQDGAVTMQQDLTTHATAFVINARAKHRL
ncbi:unnamed protein product [Arctogadus glacialis]